MAVTIMEALMNADLNLSNVKRQRVMAAFVVGLAAEQLHNAVELLNKGYSLNDEVEPLLEKYGDVEQVPEKE
jgi:hypothetical protein